MIWRKESSFKVLEAVCVKEGRSRKPVRGGGGRKSVILYENKIILTGSGDRDMQKRFQNPQGCHKSLLNLFTTQ